MENRFGFRDLVICVLLVIMAVSVWLAMVQMDRQATQIKQMGTEIKEQTSDIARIRRLIEQGVPVAASQGASTTKPTTAADNEGWVGAGTDPFARVKKAQAIPGYVTGDNFISAFGVIPDKLTPIISSDAYASRIQSYVLESLANRDPDSLEWSPLIASRWKIEDTSKAWQAYVDGRMKVPLTREEVLKEADAPKAASELETYVKRRLEEGRRPSDISHEDACPTATTITFELRRGVTFSDGEPLTVDDVVFSFDWMMHPDVESPRSKAYYDKIRKVVRVDDKTVAFYFREPYFQSFELAGGMSILPKHFYSKYSPTDFNRSTGLLLGSGPYRLPDASAWKPEPGKPIELLRNERYWGERPPFDRMIFRIIDNESSRLTTFRNGDLDSIGPTPEQYKDMINPEKNKELLARTQHLEFDDPEAGYLYIGWNQQRDGKPTRFADKRVRQAMTLLTDRNRIVREIELGYGSVPNGPFSKLSKQSDKSVQPWPFDIDQAKKLLKDAGYEDRDGDGVLEGPDKQPMQFKLMFPASGDTFKRVVLFLKDTYLRAGVEVVPEPTEWSVLIKRLDTRDFEACSLGWSGGIENDPYQIFHSSQIKGTGDNFVSYANPELDRLIDAARSTVDESKRMPLWHKVQHILHEDQPYTFLYVRKSLVFMDGRFQNVQRVTTGLNERIEWFVPKEQWKWTKPK